MNPSTNIPTPSVAVCELCGEPMPEGETMFKYHGLSGPCPKPMKEQADASRPETAYEAFRSGFSGTCPAPAWNEAATWVRDVALVCYLQGKLDAKPSPSPVPTDDGLEMAAKIADAQQNACEDLRDKAHAAGFLETKGRWDLAAIISRDIASAIRNLKTNSNSLPAPAIEDGVVVPRAALQKVVNELFEQHDGEWNSITTPDEVVALCAALQSTTPPAASGRNK